MRDDCPQVNRFKRSMASSEISLEAVASVSQIPADEWDACANPVSHRLRNGNDKQA